MIALLIGLFLASARADFMDLPTMTVFQGGTWTIQQGSPPWSVSQFGVWTVGRTWTLSSGTDSITSIQGTSPWVTNISQFGGSNVVTGTGNSGAGIPRVTVSNDSSITNITGTVSLPTGASTAANQSTIIANQTNGTQKTQIVDGANATVGPVTTISGVNYAPVTLAASATSGSPVVARSVQVSGTDGTNARTMATDTSGDVKAVGNVASGVADSGNPMKTGAVYNSTLPTPTSGQRVDAQANAFGELACRSRNKYLNMVGIVTTTVKSGPGVLHNICINNGANATVLTIYDNTTATGTKIGTADVLGINNNVLRCLQYDAEFTTGLTIVSAGSAANDITVTYQ